MPNMQDAVAGKGKEGSQIKGKSRWVGLGGVVVVIVS